MSLRSPPFFGKAFAIPILLLGIILALNRRAGANLLSGLLGLATTRVRVKLAVHRSPRHIDASLLSRYPLDSAPVLTTSGK